jgi:hypothetical protein
VVNVTNGGTLSASYYQVGFNAGTETVTTLSGTGSKISGGRTILGQSGSSYMRITDGAILESTAGYGYMARSDGSYSLVNISNGGRYLNVSHFRMNESTSSVAVIRIEAEPQMKSDYPGGPVVAFTAGTVSFATGMEKCIKVWASPGLAAGTYDAANIYISGSQRGKGYTRGYGGVVNEGDLSIAVTAAKEGGLGTTSVDFTTNRRLSITNTLRGIEIAFTNTTGSADMTVSSTSGPSAAEMASVGGKQVRASYAFTSTITDTVLSLGMGKAYPYDTVSIWKDEGSGWTVLDSKEIGLVISDSWACFKAPSFSSYAVVTTVPPQGTLVTVK